MSCEKYQDLLIEAARQGGEAPDHARDCPECAALFRRQRKLSAAMAKLSVETDAIAWARLPVLWPPVPLPLRSRRLPLWAGAAIAAGVAIAFVLWPAQTPHPAPPAIAPAAAPAVVADRAVPGAVTLPPYPVQSARHKRRKSKAPAKPETASEPFYSIPYTLPLAEGERAEILRMEMPVAALIAAGFQVATPDPSQMAQADVIVGQDGRARAIRLISVSDNNSQRSIYQ